MTNQSNYDKWRGSDRHNGKTKEALLKSIVRRLEAVGITHRDSAGVREKINTLEKQYRLEEDFRTGTGAGITDEKDLRAALLKRCPYYYDLHDGMVNRPSIHPKVTSDDLDAAELGDGVLSTAILQKGDRRPLAAEATDDNKKQKLDSVDRLLDQQAELLRAREEKRELINAHHSRDHALKVNEMELKEEKNIREKAQAEVDLALKTVQLQVARCDAATQLLLSRKKLQDNGVPQETLIICCH